MNNQNRNLEQELKELNILSFDSDGITTKDDIFVALDAIKEHISNNSDKDALDYIAKRRKEKSRFFAR